MEISAYVVIRVPNEEARVFVDFPNDATFDALVIEISDDPYLRNLMEKVAILCAPLNGVVGITPRILDMVPLVIEVGF